MRELKKAGQIWKEFEDYLAPLLGMKPGERSVYSYLVRHTRLEGRREVAASAGELGRGTGIGNWVARVYLLRLARKGCVRVKRRGRRMRIAVLLPREIVPPLRLRDLQRFAPKELWPTKKLTVREALLLRERGRCFYCQQKLVKGQIWFDHVVALARGGSPHKENVVACCQACNRSKGTRSAAMFLRKLYRQKLISKAQYWKQLVTVRELLRGKLGLRKAA